MARLQGQIVKLEIRFNRPEAGNESVSLARHSQLRKKKRLNIG
jgi:hypothetical protein